MNFIQVLSCLSLVLAASAAPYPEPCVAPPLMTGGFSVVSNGLMAAGNVIYDALGHKMRVRSYGTTGNDSFSLDQLMLFHEEAYYEIDWEKFSCRKKPLDSSFEPMHVPKDAVMSGQVILGSSSGWGMGILVNNWSGNLPRNGSYTMVFSDLGCIPMTYAGFGPGIGSTFISTYNWVLGITNPSDLLPPMICANAKLEETETPDTVFTAMASLATKSMRSG